MLKELKLIKKMKKRKNPNLKKFRRKKNKRNIRMARLIKRLIVKVNLKKLQPIKRNVFYDLSIVEPVVRNPPGTAGSKRPGVGTQPTTTDPKKTPVPDKKGPGATGTTGRVSTGVDAKNPKPTQPKT